LFYKTGFTN